MHRSLRKRHQLPALAAPDTVRQGSGSGWMEAASLGYITNPAEVPTAANFRNYSK